MWLCKCDCGTVKYVAGQSLNNGKSTGCHACLWNRQQHPRAHTDGSRRWIDNKKTHIYSAWLAMKQRCNKPYNKSYKNYGGRGIKVCKEWDESFQAYYEYVSKLEHYGEDGYSLDRIDNNGNYEPGNVKYSTRSEQEHNKRAKRIYSCDNHDFYLKLRLALADKKMTRKELAEKMNVDYQTVGIWVNGKGLPNKERMKKICEMLSINSD